MVRRAVVGAEAALVDADIRVIDVAVDDVVGRVSVEPFADHIGQVPDGQQVVAAVEPHPVGEVEALAASVPDSGGVAFVPAFVGLGAPYWDPQARGAIFGLTRGTTGAHLARAALESIALQVADLVGALEQESHLPLAELRVDGGAAANNLLLQLQADLLGRPVVRPQITETTALGAAYLAGLAVGVWRDERELATLWQAERRFEPRMPPAEVAAIKARWQEAVSRCRGWAT